MKTNCPDCNKELRAKQEKRDISDLMPWVEKGKMMNVLLVEECNCKK